MKMLKKIQNAIYSFIKNENFSLKLAALGIAILIWFAVVNVDDPMVTRTFTNIPVTITNVEIVTNQGKVLQILDDTSTVRVTVTSKRSIMTRLSTSSFAAIADISQMEPHTLLVPINVSIRGIDSEKYTAVVNPRNIQVKIEDSTKASFPISVSTTGTPRDGYVLGEMTANPGTVTIKGSESMINNIQKVVAQVNVSGLSKSSEVEAELILYDGNGNTVDQSQLSNNLGEDALSVYVQILNTRTVPIQIDMDSTPADGYILTGISSVPEKIQICGTQEELDLVESIQIPPDALDISDLTEKTELTFDITPYLPEGITLYDENANNILLIVDIEQVGSKTFELPLESIRIKNLSEELKVSFLTSEDLKLQFYGQEDQLDILDIRNAVSIDLKECTVPGAYDIALQIDTDLNVHTVQVYKVSIILTEKQEEGTDSEETESPDTQSQSPVPGEKVDTKEGVN